MNKGICNFLTYFLKLNVKIRSYNFSAIRQCQVKVNGFSVSQSIKGSYHALSLNVW